MGLNKVPPILIYDFETGGFESQIHAVTEFAGIFIDGDTLEEICRYEAVLKPYHPDLLYTPEALKASNMTMEIINNGIDFKTFTRDFTTFLRKGAIHSGEKYKPIVGGHNIVFDNPFMQQLFHHMGKKIQEFLNCKEDFYGNWYPKYVDSLTWAMIAYPELLSHKLGECVIHSGAELVNAHRAMTDVKGNGNLFEKFFKNLRGTGNVVVDTAEKTLYREAFKF
jgi:DNA polymerase III alpha subunit (gram-positive type)